jgi:hypothetical protein
MKITDTVGRSLLVDLVYRDSKGGWLQAPVTTLKGRGTQFAKLPYGEYAIRICSLLGAEVIVFEDGKRLIQTSVPVRTQFISNDSDGNAFAFRAPGDVRETPATDVNVHVDTTDGGSASDGEAVVSDEVLPLGPQPVAGHGMVYVVVRLAKENNPVHTEPPQEEFEIAFQMMEPGEFDEFFAQNLRLVEEAPALPNKLDPMSLTAPVEGAEDHRPSIHCVFSGCKH